MTGCKIGKIRLKNGGAELRVFEGRPKLPNAEAVAYLEQALSKARRGEFQSVAIAAVTNEGYANCAFAVSQHDNVLLLLGATEWVADRLMDEAYGS